jgi:hypothetical protein
MAVKTYYLDKRVTKTPTIDGSLANLQNVLNLKTYTESIIASQPTEFFADGTAAAPSITFEGDTDTGIFLGGNNILGFSANGTKVLDVRTSQVTVLGTFVLQDYNVLLGTTTGTKLGTATSQKLGFWNATPIVQPTTAIAGATNVGGAGTTVKVDDTFDGYTIAQVVKALRNEGLLA